MENIQENLQAGKLFSDFLTSIISREDLAQRIDGAIWDLTRYQLEDENFCGGMGCADTISFLRHIRNICLLHNSQ